MSDVFLIGNGESRKNVDLERYRPHGKLYGCNALTRDILPDVVTAVDNGIMHEIYHKGIAHKVPCYFRNWTKVPAFTFDMMKKDSGLNDDQMQYMLDKGYMVTNERSGTTPMFVMHGSAVSGMAEIVKKNGEREKKNVNVNNIYVSWIDPNIDKSFSLTDIMKDREGPKDLGWAAGPTSGYVACKIELPILKRAFLLGHDLFSHSLHVNNMYKSTKHYVTAEHQPTPASNWVRQWSELFQKFKEVEFYKVQLPYDKGNKTTHPVLEWSGIKNIHYIDYSTLDKMLNV